MSFIVAIDGPAGTGKSTISRLVANSLGLILIDTGAMYRSVAYEMIKKSISLDNDKAILELLNNFNIEFKNTENGQEVYLNGENVTKEIRLKQVNDYVSPVSTIKEIRYKMVEIQRKLVEKNKVVMEGRDIGTYVFPNADVKIYLDASIEARAKRRFDENVLKGINMTYEEVINNIASRDKSDSEREVGALKIATDAIIIDTSNLTLEEVKQKIEEIIKEKL